MERYFDVIRRALERHGGTVDKFIGDAVVRVFGVPCCMRTTLFKPPGLLSKCATRYTT